MFDPSVRRFGGPGRGPRVVMRGKVWVGVIGGFWGFFLAAFSLKLLLGPAESYGSAEKYRQR